MRANRMCSRCGEVEWTKEIPPGARKAKFHCAKCGLNTKRMPRPRAKRETFGEAGKTRTELDKEALRIWSLVVRRVHPICQRCRVKPTSEAHHLITRARRRYRYDITNGAGLCGGCHMEVTRDGHENRTLAISLLGESEWEQRQILKRLTCKVDPSLEIVALREMLREGR